MIALYAAVGLAAVVFILSYLSFRMAFYVPKHHPENPYDLPEGPQYDPVKGRMTELIGEMETVCFERVTITAYDGTQLSGRYFHTADNAPLQLQFHGYRGGALRDFCGGNRLARNSGHNTLLIDQRAHGESEGTVITFGIRERRDCLSWITYAVERFGQDTQIFLTGISMGAATVLMAADLPLPRQVVGIIADSPYSSPAAIIRKVTADLKLPTALAFPFIRLGAAVFGRFDLTEHSAVEAVRHAAVPILLIHGEDDRFVPCSMSRELADACTSPVTLATFPDAAHGISFMHDPARYKALVGSFMERCLQQEKNRSPQN